MVIIAGGSKVVASFQLAGCFILVILIRDDNILIELYLPAIDSVWGITLLVCTRLVACKSGMSSKSYELLSQGISSKQE
jgi:hypothetical protein